jgi:hypothetical protein
MPVDCYVLALRQKLSIGTVKHVSRGKKKALELPPGVLYYQE